MSNAANTAEKIDTKTTEPRTVRKLTIEILDAEAVLAAYPGVEVIVTQRTIDRRKLRPIVNALHAIDAEVPGVRAYYAADEKDDADADDKNSAAAAVTATPNPVI